MQVYDWLEMIRQMFFEATKVGRLLYLIKEILRLRPFIHGERTNTRAVQLITANRCCAPVCNLFFGYFSGLGNIASPSSNEHGTWWASNIRPFD